MGWEYWPGENTDHVGDDHGDNLKLCSLPIWLW